jgi:hypothetical protein
MTRTPEEIELARRRDGAASAQDFDAAFLEAQRLLASVRARGDRADVREAMEEFAGLLQRAGDVARAERTREYLRSGFEPRAPGGRRK